LFLRRIFYNAFNAFDAFSYGLEGKSLCLGIARRVCEGRSFGGCQRRDAGNYRGLTYVASGLLVRGLAGAGVQREGSAHEVGGVVVFIALFKRRHALD